MHDLLSPQMRVYVDVAFYIAFLALSLLHYQGTKGWVRFSELCMMTTFNLVIFCVVVSNSLSSLLGLGAIVGAVAGIFYVETKTPASTFAVLRRRIPSSEADMPSSMEQRLVNFLLILSVAVNILLLASAHAPVLTYWFLPILILLNVGLWTLFRFPRTPGARQ